MRVHTKKSVLPSKITDWFTTIFSWFYGVIITISSILLFIALVSYSPFDPSFNTSATIVVHNKLDVVGAYLADFLKQYIGNGAYYFSLVLLVLGIFKIRRPTLKIKSINILALLGISCLMTVALGLFSKSPTGIIEVLFSQKIVFIFHEFGLNAFLPFLFLALVSVNLGITLLVFGAKFESTLAFLQNIYKYINAKILHIQGKTFQRTEHDKIQLHIKRPQRNALDAATSTIADTYQNESNDSDQDNTTLENEDIALPGFKITHDIPGNQASLSDIFDQHFPSTKDHDTPYRPKATKNTAASDAQIPNSDFHLPPVELLDEINATKNIKINQELLLEQATQLKTVLEEYGIKGEIVNIRPGPVVTMYEFKPAAGIKTARVISLADDIARSMSALSARIATIPGQNVIGIELPNINRTTVYIRDIFQSQKYDKTNSGLPIILGKDIGGEPVIADLTRMPHLLVAGTTGSGKSVSVNAMILSLLFKLPPEKCKFIMIDPKMLELSVYDDIPHLLTPVVTDPKKAVVALKWAVKEMENRYRAMSKLGVRNIDGYNSRIQEAIETGEVLSKRVQIGFDSETGKPIFETQNLSFDVIPYIVVVVDEMADLMMVAGKEIESAVQRLAQMARAAGIHLIMATQRPSVDVITGTIKANFPTRISFMVTSKIDSRTILGEQGAEQLLGQGDMLFMAGGGRISRVHGPFVKDSEVERVVQFLKTQGTPSYIDSITENDDELTSGEDGEEGGDSTYKQAIQVIMREGKVSTSFIQRHLSIGYNKAAKIIEQMEKDGVISHANHSGKREILKQL
jgi:S-DNA-T family DNA segregation ATPase FtsK/SpoIIIE